MKGITLIGMPCSGKSTLGRKLAEVLNWKYIDLDIYIKEKEAAAAGNILKTKGGQELSNLEEKYALELNFDSTVFAPGGSMVYATRAMEKLKKDTIIIYLDQPLEEIERRVNRYPNNSRGIIGLEEKGIRGLFAERVPLYKKYADYTYQGPWEKPDDMIPNILADLELP